MEHLPGYDQWKTRLPEEPDMTECVVCGKEIYKYDSLRTVEGYKCDDCLNVEEEEDELL